MPLYKLVLEVEIPEIVNESIEIKVDSTIENALDDIGCQVIDSQPYVLLCDSCYAEIKDVNTAIEIDNETYCKDCQIH